MIENLKWSRYNFLWSSDKYGKLLYNSYTNGFLKLDDTLFFDLGVISKNENSVLGDCFSREEINYLKDNFILVENDDFLLEQLHHESMSRLYNKKHLVLSIAPTLYCNFIFT